MGTDPKQNLPISQPAASGHRVAFARVRCSRNLSSQRFLPACSSEDRRSAEAQLVWETQILTGRSGRTDHPRDVFVVRIIPP